MNNVMGMYSGIDMATIEQLLQAESSRGTRFTAQKSEYEKEKTAWKDVNGRLDNLYKKLEVMKNPDTFNAKKVTTSSEDFLTVSAGDNSATGEFRIQVTRLAASTRLTGKQVDAEEMKTALTTLDSSTEGATLTIKNGELNEDQTAKEYKFNIAPESTLQDIKDQINEQSKESKISASIVDNRLILKHTETGSKELTVGGTATDALGLTDSDTTDNNNVTFTQGNGSTFEIDGLKIERDSNTIDDVIEGVTFTLKNVHEGIEADTVKIEADTAKSADAMKALIDQYNSTLSFIGDQLSVGDPSVEDNKVGTLSGDSSLLRLQTSLRSMFTRNIESKTETYSKSADNLQDLGVEIDRYGVATFDREKFIEKLETNQEDVVKFFHSSAEVKDENDKPKTIVNGFANKARSFVDEYISSSSTGIIKTKNDTYDRMIKDINERIDTFNDRIEMKRQQYITTFTALDTAMMQAESQLSFMMGQLGGATSAPA